MSNVYWKNGKAFHVDGYEIEVAKGPDYSDVDIDWEIGDEYDNAGDGYVTFHMAEGFDNDGNEYRGSAPVMNGEIIDSVEDIEKI